MQRGHSLTCSDIWGLLGAVNTSTRVAPAAVVLTCSVDSLRQWVISIVCSACMCVCCVVVVLCGVSSFSLSNCILSHFMHYCQACTLWTHFVSTDRLTDTHSYTHTRIHSHLTLTSYTHSHTQIHKTQSSTQTLLFYSQLLNMHSTHACMDTCPLHLIIFKFFLE